MKLKKSLSRLLCAALALCCLGGSAVSCAKNDQSVINRNITVASSSATEFAEVLTEKGKLSKESERLIKEYCRSVNMPDEVFFRKMLLLRSLLNGSAILINSGEIPFDSHTMNVIRANIEREFEIE